MATVPPRSTGHDDGRLPWIDTPPASAARAVPPPARSGLRWFAGLLVIALVAVAGFLLGRRSDEPPVAAAPPPLATAPLANARPEIAPAVAPPMERQTAPALARAEAETSRRTPAEPAPPLLKLRRDQVRAVRQIAHEAEVEARRNAARQVATRQAFSLRIAPPGRVVQLGAYRTVAEAESAAQAFRYKYRGLLAPLPKAVLPFRPKASLRMFYRVQFITPSQAYSEVTCQRLRAARKSCIVVY